MKHPQLVKLLFGSILVLTALAANSYDKARNGSQTRQRISINRSWRFFKYDLKPDSLIYDMRPEVSDKTEYKVADAQPTEAAEAKSGQEALKAWILPSGNDFIKDPAR